MRPFEILEKKYRGLLYEYLLESPAMILGERFKGGIFRPSSKVLRYSQITGALRAELGIQDIHAAGVIERFDIDFFIYSPQDKVAGRSKVPLTAEVLTNVRARMYIASPTDLPEKLVLRIGALATKGFGESRLRLERVIKAGELRKSIGETSRTLREGGLPELAARLPLREEIYMGVFEVTKIIKPIYYYMFYPTSPITVYYELSLKEDSIVIAPSILIRKHEEIFLEGWGMSSIDSLIKRIARDGRLRGIQFTREELNDLAEIYERYGFTVAEIHLRRRIERARGARNEQEQYKLRTLLDVLNLVESSRIPRQMGAYIIRPRYNSYDEEEIPMSIKYVEYEIVLRTESPFRVGRKKDPFTTIDQHIIMIGNRVVIPGTTLKGALREAIERYLIENYSNKPGMRPCLPATPQTVTPDEMELIHQGKYKGAGCHFRVCLVAKETLGVKTR